MKWAQAKPKETSFVLNTRSKVVHRYPTHESCNLDQVPRKYREFVHSSKEYKRCKHCFQD